MYFLRFVSPPFADEGVFPEGREASTIALRKHFESKYFRWGVLITYIRGVLACLDGTAACTDWLTTLLLVPVYFDPQSCHGNPSSIQERRSSEAHLLLPSARAVSQPRGVSGRPQLVLTGVLMKSHLYEMGEHLDSGPWRPRGGPDCELQLARLSSYQVSKWRH